MRCEVGLRGRIHPINEKKLATIDDRARLAGQGARMEAGGPPPRFDLGYSGLKRSMIEASTHQRSPAPALELVKKR